MSPDIGLEAETASEEPSAKVRVPEKGSPGVRDDVFGFLAGVETEPGAGAVAGEREREAGTDAAKGGAADRRPARSKTFVIKSLSRDFRRSRRASEDTNNDEAELGDTDKTARNCWCRALARLKPRASTSRT